MASAFPILMGGFWAALRHQFSLRPQTGELRGNSFRVMGILMTIDFFHYHRNLPEFVEMKSISSVYYWTSAANLTALGLLGFLIPRTRYWVLPWFLWSIVRHVEVVEDLK